ncbi:hypothetical protein F4824DRAFT_505168 [Ustulina deusta]|nr:hypothetical protein F4824DRAFT_505168 [Ustulina deusta]
MANRAINRSICFLGVYANFALSLGINCRGSGLCPRASWNNVADVSIIQLLRDAVYAASAPLSTGYESGDHVIYGIGGSVGLTGSLGEGGICLFPQYMADGATLSLSQIRPLMDALLEHKCATCGSVPIHFVDEGSNDPSGGILTFNYVAAPYCIGNCISAVGRSSNSSPSTNLGSTPTTTTTADPSTTTVFVVVDPSTSLSSMTKTTSNAVAASNSPTPSSNNGQSTRTSLLMILVATIGSLSLYITI